MNNATTSSNSGVIGSNSTSNKRKEIYRYDAPFTVYCVSWSTSPAHRFRLAISSFIEEYSNKVELVQLNEDDGEFRMVGSFDHPYPPTKVMWIPDEVTHSHTAVLHSTDDILFRRACIPIYWPQVAIICDCGA